MALMNQLSDDAVLLVLRCFARFLDENLFKKSLVFLVHDGISVHALSAQMARDFSLEIFLVGHRVPHFLRSFGLGPAGISLASVARVLSWSD